MATHPQLSILISNSPYLSSAHLIYQIDALNRQTCQDFQVFYLNQDIGNQDLAKALQQALFRGYLIDLPFPVLGETCCWDMVSVVANLLNQPVHGDYMTYLHKECLPAPDFVESVLAGITAAESEHGPDSIYRLNQLRSPFQVDDLSPLYPLQLAGSLPGQGPESQPIYWSRRTPFNPQFNYALSPWEEDAFALPISLARKTHLFDCLDKPLFFQDLFDIFYLLPQTIGFEKINMVHLGHPVIWHLNHPRPFYEYRREFLDAVRQKPELFGHLALYELASDSLTFADFDYQENFEQGERIIADQVHQFVHYMRYSPKGTVSLWQQALYQLHRTES